MSPYTVRGIVTAYSLTEVVKPESIMKSLETRVPADFLNMNRKALDIGIKLGEAAKS